MRENPFWPGIDPRCSPPGSSLIGEAEFAAIYAAAAFAEQFHLFLDLSVTIVWRLFGADVEDQAQRYFTAYLKALRDWLQKRALPQAWIYCHETGPIAGLHTHLAIYIPAHHRSAFRAWNQGWARRQMKRKVPRGIRTRGPSSETPWIHWLTVSYQLKGYDRGVVVQSALNSPDGQAVMLGDVIAFGWRDPGVVPMRTRIGCSYSLGPERRALGAPTNLDYLFDAPATEMFSDVIERPAHHQQLWASPTRAHRPPPPAFRSKYEDGIRDVWQLYPVEFVERVTGQTAPRPVPLETAQSETVSLDALYEELENLDI